MNTVYTSNTSGDSRYMLYGTTATSNAYTIYYGGDGYGTMYGGDGYNAYYKPPALPPIAPIEKETDFDDILKWMKRGDNIGKIAEIVKMMEEEING